MKKLEFLNASKRILLAGVLIWLWANLPAYAQRLEISKNANFSTADNSFTFSETLYARVTAAQIDYTDLDKNEFNLDPAHSGKPVAGALTNHLNGTYTMALVLLSLNQAESNWDFQVKIKDEQGNEFEKEIDLIIQDKPPLLTVELEGRLEALTANSLKISGKTIFKDAATTVTEFGRQLKFGDLQVNWKVQVRAEQRVDNFLWALTIDVLERAPMNLIETQGRMANLQDSVMIVNDLKFRLVTRTELRGKDDTRLKLADFRVGMSVEASGITQANGQVIADRVKIKDDRFVDQEIEFTGVINDLVIHAPLPDSIRINGDIFAVDGQTKLRGFNDETMILADFRRGETVEIKATTRLGSPALALRLKRQEPDGEVQAKGGIELLLDSSLVVSGVEFFRSPATIILDDESLFIPFSTLRLGFVVEVSANRQTNGRWVATLIKIADETDEQIELTGFVEALTDTSIKVFESIFLVNTVTEVLDQNNVPAQFSAVRIGTIVEISGNRRFDGSILATEIQIDDFFLDNAIVLRGAVAAVISNKVRVTDIDFLVDANTMIFDLNGNRIALTGLRAGTIVEVRAQFTGDSWLASRINLEGEIDREIALVGAIDSLKTTAFYSLRRLAWVTNATIFLGLNGEKIAFADLRANDVVEVQGRQLPDSSLVALLVKKENRNTTEVEAHGEIARQGTTALAVAAVTFTVDAATSYFDAGNQPIKLADLRDGQIAAVQGIRQSNGVFVASRIQLQNHRVLTGMVSQSPSGTVNIAGLQHRLGAQEILVDEQNHPISASAIRPQQLVRLVANSTNGEWEILNLRILRGSSTTVVEQPPQTAIPKGFVLYQNFPNPFAGDERLHSATVIRFALPRAEEVSLTIYNQLGQKIRTMTTGNLPAGLHESVWDGRDEAGGKVASGVYFYRLQAGELTQIRRMIVIR